MMAGFSNPSWSDMLDALMIRNRAARVERDARSGEIRIAVPTRRPWYHVPPVTWIVRAPEERVTVLDEPGSLVWEMCDGRTTVENIIDAFAEKYGLTFHESRVAVTQHIKSLISRGVLAVEFRDPPAPGL
ncbi:MAG TPA: PqqD family protein [Kiritimatiellia bacterium]|nr:PqqD family protein [Kiritimatiellia bacterium]HNS81257.1 PqqD family protein [Kiritimatiellia bacterium]HPA78725.1 PqqD family protein [Kiritimatiellia bacterium]HQQ04253.1 PqqD family protein [Kiritimatiellia bacterium]